MSKLTSALKNAYNSQRKKGSLKRKIAITVAPFFLLIIILAGAVSAVVSIVAGIFKAVFEPLVNVEKYQKEAVYSAIYNYGGAYKAYNLDVLDDGGVNKDVVEEVFLEEFNSYDSNVSTFTVPNISEEKYSIWLDNNPSVEDKDNSDYNDTIDVVWDLTDITYQYRTHWQYIMAICAVKSFVNEEEFEKALEAAADKIDENGNVTDTEGLYSAVTVEEIKDAVESLRSCRLWTDIQYFTNYTSDYLAEHEDDEGLLYTGDNSQEKIKSGFSFINYNYALFNDRIQRKDDFDSNGVAKSMRYSTLSMFNGKYDIGNEPGEYAYITSNGYLYPAVLIKKASNWLCTYYDYDYVKIKEGNNTHYVVTTYKKKYRIADIINQWKDFGIDEGFSEFVIDFLQKIQDDIGGTVATEFKVAYDYYMKYGEELTISYANPSYSPENFSDQVLIENEYGKELTTINTDAEGLTAALRSLYRPMSEFESDINVGIEVAQALYNYHCCYQPASSTHENAGYQCVVYNDVSYNPDKGWGNKAYDYSDSGTDDSGINDRVGLSSAGFINYILRYSMFGADNSTDTVKNLTVTPTISQIYAASNYKFRNVSELRPGDIAVLSPTNDDESTNIIGYYVGQSGNNHIFYSISPTGSFNSQGVVRKICLKDDTGDVDMLKCDLTYFCRYYYGANNEIPSEFRFSVGKQMYDEFITVSNALDLYVSNHPGQNNISHQDAFVEAVLNDLAYYGCRKYNSSELLYHISSGIMEGGYGDTRGWQWDTNEGDVYSEGYFTFPLESYVQISSWYSWRDLNDDMSDGYENWHNGLDIAAEAWTEVYAAADGVISIMVTGYNGNLGENHFSDGDGYGNYILIRHNTDGVYTRYAHLMAPADGIEEGASVKKGQLIGYVGSSGESYGYHLHFEVYDGETHFDYDGCPFPERGPRPYNRTTTVDPYQFFPELAGSSKVGSAIYWDRPRWFEADRPENLQ